MADKPNWGELALQVLDAIGIKDLIQRLVERRHYVIVIGSTGVGKTALISALNSVEQSLVKVISRTPRPKERSIRINAARVIAIDTPGELTNISARMSEMSKYFVKRRVGILIVVADGYHEYSHISERVAADEGALTSYLDRHREVEIRYLEQFASQFQFAPQIDWALVVATKADLWWGRRGEVLDSYANQRFQNLARKLCYYGAPVRPFSSATEPFLGVVPCDPSFGESSRREVRESFLDTFFEQLAN